VRNTNNIAITPLVMEIFLDKNQIVITWMTPLGYHLPAIGHVSLVEMSLSSLVQNFGRVVVATETAFPRVSKYWLLKNGRWMGGPSGVPVTEPTPGVAKILRWCRAWKFQETW
jgi:hypothetical protein